MSGTLGVGSWQLQLGLGVGVGLGPCNRSGQRYSYKTLQRGREGNGCNNISIL